MLLSEPDGYVRREIAGQEIMLHDKGSRHVAQHLAQSDRLTRASEVRENGGGDPGLEGVEWCLIAHDLFFERSE